MDDTWCVVWVASQLAAVALRPGASDEGHEAVKPIHSRLGWPILGATGSKQLARIWLTYRCSAARVYHAEV